MTKRLTIEVALAVQKEIEERGEEADRLRQREVEQARYATDLARRRYMHVDPGNRMVADALEADWNASLRELAETQDRYQKRRERSTAIDEHQRAEITALATDFPRVWSDPRTPDRERKRMARLLLDDVTLLKSAEITLGVRFKGGATKTLLLPRPKPAWLLRQTGPAVVAAVDRLLDRHTDAEVAEHLNAAGLTSGEGQRFHRLMVRNIRQGYGLKTRYQRLRERGLLEEREVAALLDVKPLTIKIWRRAGLLAAHAYDDKGSCLYERPDESAPKKYRHQNKTTGRTPAAGRSYDRNTSRGAM